MIFSLLFLCANLNLVKYIIFQVQNGVILDSWHHDLSECKVPVLLPSGQLGPDHLENSTLSLIGLCVFREASLDIMGHLGSISL